MGYHPFFLTAFILPFSVPSTNTIDPLNDEDKAKQLLHDKIKKEYKHAINVEGRVGLSSILFHYCNKPYIIII